MATLKAIVKSEAKNGMYPVYIRITQKQTVLLREDIINQHSKSIFLRMLILHGFSNSMNVCQPPTLSVLT